MKESNKDFDNIENTRSEKEKMLDDIVKEDVSIEDTKLIPDEEDLVSKPHAESKELPKENLLKRMSNGQKIASGAAAALLLAGLGVTAYMNSIDSKEAPKQQANTLNTKQTKKVQPAKKASTSSKAKEVKVDSSKTILENANEVKMLVRSLAEVNNSKIEEYKSIVSKLKEFGITIDGNLSGPYGLYEFYPVKTDKIQAADGSVTDYEIRSTYVSYITKDEVAEDLSSFHYVVRGAFDQIDYGSSQSDQNEAILASLKQLESENDEKYNSEVTFKLAISEDGKSGTLTVDDPDWWTK